ncbi:uncharacterized protein LOC123398898 [Hordeum vulgare subsp. vulgare]|uniref:uncharacterized protein LOC123398898 n=1 Tax=Hordeum vulgare subsp. vulgare TaxID=112509 RepID=UPI001D1A444C|nr:uncharacterized protein LOC123398898 [Hordeum vulgare subsp. vulgare]
MAMSAPELSPSPLPMDRASPSSGEAAAILHFSREAPLHQHRGRPSATASHLAATTLRSASSDPMTASEHDEERRSPCTFRPAVPRGGTTAATAAGDLPCLCVALEKKTGGGERR